MRNLTDSSTTQSRDNNTHLQIATFSAASGGVGETLTGYSRKPFVVSYAPTDCLPYGFTDYARMGNSQGSVGATVAEARPSVSRRLHLLLYSPLPSEEGAP